MAKGDWWLKLEINVWLHDLKLRGLKRENRDTWLTALLLMRLEGVDRLSGEPSNLAALLHLTAEEFEDFIEDIKRNKTANVTRVTQSNGRVTLVSRRFNKELKSKEQTKLRVQKHRGNADVTLVKRDRVKSYKLEVIDKKEEEREETASPKPKPSLFPIPRVDTDPDLWSEWLEMRRKLKKPLTQLGYDRLVKELSSLIAFDLNDRLALAIDRKWQGLVFAEDKNGNGTNHKSFRQQRADEAKQSYERESEIRRRVAERDQQLSRQALPDSGGQLQLVEPDADG